MNVVHYNTVFTGQKPLITETNNTTKYFTAYLVLYAVNFIWGLVWPVAKIGLNYISPLWFVEYRLLIAMIILFIIVIAMGIFTLPRKRDLLLLLIISIFQTGLFLMLLTVGLQYVDAGRSSILAFTTPIWVTPIAYFVFKEPLPRLTFIGLMLGVCGLLVLFGPWGIDWQNFNVVLGNILILLSAFSWAIAMLSARYLPWYSSPLQMAPWQMLVALLFTLPFAILLEPHPMLIWNHESIFALAFSSVLATAFGFWGVVYASKELPVISTSLAILSTPVISIIAAYFMLHEPITLNKVTALIFILGGLTCAAFGNRKQKK